jgi:allantoin racemase
VLILPDLLDGRVRRAQEFLVVNPNSNEIVTKGLADALAPVAFADGPEIECRTLAEGPYGIETQEHVESVTHEAGVLTALARGGRFGVIAIGQRSIRRHVRYMRQMGLMDRFAGERPLNMSVAETASGEGTLARMIAVGRELRDEDGADVIVMGCAGMARHRAPLEAALGVPVIDPTQAAVAMAIGTVQFAGG